MSNYLNLQILIYGFNLLNMNHFIMNCDQINNRNCLFRCKQNILKKIILINRFSAVQKFKNGMEQKYPGLTIGEVV